MQVGLSQTLEAKQFGRQPTIHTHCVTRGHFNSKLKTTIWRAINRLQRFCCVCYIQCTRMVESCGRTTWGCCTMICTFDRFRCPCWSTCSHQPGPLCLPISLWVHCFHWGCCLVSLCGEFIATFGSIRSFSFCWALLIWQQNEWTVIVMFWLCLCLFSAPAEVEDVPPQQLSMAILYNQSVAWNTRVLGDVHKGEQNAQFSFFN